MAWAKLRELKLGWDMKFEGDTGDLTVNDAPSRPPVPRSPRARRSTCTSAGPPRWSPMPALVGLPCDQVGDKLTDAGSLVADYPAGRTGVVKSQDPARDRPAEAEVGRQRYEGHDHLRLTDLSFAGHVGTCEDPVRSRRG